MASDVQIVNLALAHLGVGKAIANLETEQSQEARSARVFFEIARDEVLRDFHWPFATKFEALELVEAEPIDEWAFSYRYPTDCLKIRKVISSFKTDTQDTLISYRVGSDDAGLLVYCDLENAEIEYTKRADNPTFYPSDFSIAFSYKLASFMAPSVTAGDPYGFQKKCLELYVASLSMAEKNAANEDKEEAPQDSEFIRVRE